jgi:putative transposase
MRSKLVFDADGFRRVYLPRLGNMEQQAKLTRMRKEIPWLRAAPCRSQQIVLQNLDAAWQMGLRDKDFGIPKFKKFSDPIGMTIKVAPEFSAQRHIKDGKVFVNRKVGWIDILMHRKIVGSIKRVTVVREGIGWFVSFGCDLEIPDPGRSQLPVVGIDRGVVINLADSDGRFARIPRDIKRVSRLVDRLKSKNDKKLDGKKKGEKRSEKWIKGQRRISKLQARVARMRRAWLHKQALYYAENYGVVVIEDLKIRNMTKSAKGDTESPGKNVRQKAGLNRSILEQGWYMFVQMLCYKMEERGGVVVKVPAMNTSITCVECGHVDKNNRRSQAKFKCVECGYEENADTNAAIEIKNRYLRGNFELEGGYKVKKKPKKKVFSIRKKKEKPVFQPAEASSLACP